MRAGLAQLRWRWRQVPGRTRLAAVVAALAIAGLAWQHYNAPAAAERVGAAQVRTDSGDTAVSDRRGASAPDSTSAAAAPLADYSPAAARATAERFAANFASPNGDREDWLARIGADATPELLDQYRLTTAGVAQTVVARVDGPVASNPTDPTFHVDFGDGSSIEVTLAMDAAGWRVSGVVPVASSAAGPESAAPLAPVSAIG